MLTHRGRILVYLRDDRPGLPYAGCWDLPGGGREGNESPLGCALRELHEEFGLVLAPGRLRGRRFLSVAAPGQLSWLFAGRLRGAEIAAIRFGDEGQEWQMMPLAAYLTHPAAVAHFRDWVAQMRDQPAAISDRIARAAARGSGACQTGRPTTM